MSFLTGLALRRRSVTMLLILLLLGGGVLTYRSLPVELFPEIEFPLITVSTFYPSANPEAVVRDVTTPIENLISRIDGVESVQSVSSENRSLILANFTFGTDMAGAERTITSDIDSIRFPAGVEEPRVGRIGPDAFPVLQLSVLGDRDISEIQRIVDTQLLPAIRGVEGVFSIEVTGAVRQQVLVTLDPDRLSRLGISPFQVANALRENNVTLPAGAITEQGQTFPVRTTHSYDSLEELRGLVVGFSGAAPSQAGGSPPRAVLLSDVASVALGAGDAFSISRTNGRLSMGINVIKEPDANTVEVTSGVLEALETLRDLPPDIEILTLSNDGPAIQAQVSTLQREASLGFLFAMAVVFAFLVTVRPSLLRGVALTLRPSLVIGLSIPLSIFTGIILMASQGMTLNLMTLGGLAISVGRVVDDSIVVLENVYRHIHRGEDRLRVTLEATREVAPAITASTLTTIVIFLPLAFIQGLVGSFFLPFAITVSFALLASLLVALTAVPVLGAIFLRSGDIPASAADDIEDGAGETWMQRAYAPVLLWTLRHKAVSLLGSLLVTVASLGLLVLIPVTLFPSGGERFLLLQVSLPPGTSVEETLAGVQEVEEVLEELSEQGVAELYGTTVGSSPETFGPGVGNGGSNTATIFVRLAEEAPEDMAASLRARLAGGEGRTVSITEIDAGGPPESGLEMSIAGDDYAAVSAVADRLVEEVRQIPGIVNVSSDVAEARDEIVVTVQPREAAAFGLTARDVAFQVNQFLTGQTVTQMNLDGAPINVVLRGPPEGVESIAGVNDILIAGPMSSIRLGEIAQVSLEQGPVSIARSDGRRSASITGDITDENTQAVGRRIQEQVDAIGLPPGVEVTTGGVFQQIAEGFQDIFLAMGVGVILVYLVMVAALGSLRNPFVIVLSLPLAIIGALAALAVTGRALGLPAMMGMLLLIGIVVTNAIVLIAFVEQLRERGLSIHDALVQGGRVRLRPILMTAFTTSFALLPLAAFVSDEGGIIGAELATVVIGGLISSSFLTLVVVPVIYTIVHAGIPGLLHSLGARLRRAPPARLAASGGGE